MCKRCKEENRMAKSRSGDLFTWSMVKVCAVDGGMRCVWMGIKVCMCTRAYTCLMLDVVVTSKLAYEEIQEQPLLFPLCYPITSCIYSYLIKSQKEKLNITRTFRSFYSQFHLPFCLFLWRPKSL